MLVGERINRTCVRFVLVDVVPSWGFVCRCRCGQSERKRRIYECTTCWTLLLGPTLALAVLPNLCVNCFCSRIGLIVIMHTTRSTLMRFPLVLRMITIFCLFLQPVSSQGCWLLTRVFQPTMQRRAWWEELLSGLPTDKIIDYELARCSSSKRRGGGKEKKRESRVENQRDFRADFRVLMMDAEGERVCMMAWCWVAPTNQPTNKRQDDERVAPQSTRDTIRAKQP